MMSVNDSLGNGEAQSCSHRPLPRFGRPVESLKNALMVGRRNHPALILHAHADSFRRHPHSDRDRRPGHGVLHGIIHELGEGNGHELAIRQDRNFFPLHGHLKPRPLGLILHFLDGGANQFGGHSGHKNGLDLGRLQIRRAQ